MPSVTQTILLTIKIISISLLLLNNIFLIDITTYGTTLYARLSDLYLKTALHASFSKEEISFANAPEYRIFLSDKNNLTISINNLFNKWNSQIPFIAISNSLHDDVTQNTLLHTFITKYNKRIVNHKIACTRRYPPNYIYIIATDWSYQFTFSQWPDNTNIFESFAGEDADLLSFLEPYMTKRYLHHMINFGSYHFEHAYYIFRVPCTPAIKDNLIDILPPHTLQEHTIAYISNPDE